MAYKSFFRPQNRGKYIGDIDNIVCRSTWERQLAKWADRNIGVRKWSMETVIIPYFDKGTGRNRRYFVDFYLEFENDERILVEVKPKCQTIAPEKKTRMSKKYIREVRQYATNISKWEQAKKYAKKKNMKFYVWTEDQLRQLGLKVM